MQYIVNGAPQVVEIVAIDGYPIASGNSGQQYESETSVLLPPAARAEFVVTTPNTGDQAQLITQKWNNGSGGPSDPARPIANIVSGVQGSQNSLSTKSVEKLRSSTEPAGGMRFADLAAAPAIATRTLYFSEGLVDPTNPQSPYGFYITEEGQQPAVFNMSQQPNIVVHSGAVEDWVIENRATEDHIFHIHQIHFQVLEVNGQAVNDAAIRDTVDVPYWSGSGPYPKVKLHMDFRDPNIVGTFVYHCHILAHEDNGMMGEIQVLPPGTASMTTADVSESYVAPNENITLTANVLDATTGKATPGGLVQFLLNGTNLGEPTPLANGQAQLAAVINGNEGINELAVFYQGDSQYAESTSQLTPITISRFALSSIGAKAVAGTAAIANVTVNVANNYTAPISLTCTVPASLTNTSCSVNPISITGTGEVSLTVNSGAMHQPNSKLTRRTGIFVGASYTSLSCLLLVGFQRCRWSGGTIIACAILASFVTLFGCGSVSPTGPGTKKGTFNVMVTGTSGSGSSLSQASIDVPITIQ